MDDFKEWLDCEIKLTFKTLENARLFRTDAVEYFSTVLGTLRVVELKFSEFENLNISKESEMTSSDIQISVGNENTYNPNCQHFDDYLGCCSKTLLACREATCPM
jgi:hypothetical protein